MGQFDSDLAEASAELQGARQYLIDSIAALTEEELRRSRRGGWSVQRVLQHVIQADWGNVRMVGQLRQLPREPSPDEIGSPATAADALQQLSTIREALLRSLDGVDEASFYELGAVRGQEYSVLSVLENAAHHDREHGQQIRSIIQRTTFRESRTT